MNWRVLGTLPACHTSADLETFAFSPGPKLNAISRLPHVRDLLQGTTLDTINKLHQKYGEVVRFSPNEISFTSVESAFPDIYGFRTGKLKGHLNMQKDPVCALTPLVVSDSCIDITLLMRSTCRCGMLSQQTAYRPS